MKARPEEPPDPWQPARLAILAAASAGDAGGIYRLVAGLMSDGVPFATILFEVLSPLEAEVGNRWHQGDFSVSEEHTVTATLETVVALLAGSFDIPADARRVVVACAEGDSHSLPARMVAAHLVFLGWRAVFLGPSVPAADLGAFLRERPPEALVLSCAMVTALPGARDSIREAHRAGGPVLAGGSGFGRDGARARLLGADAWTAHPVAVDEILRTWQPDLVSAESGARDGGAHLDPLHRQRARVLAGAVKALDRPQVAADRARLRSDLDLILDAVAAALLLDEPALLADFIAWWRSIPIPAGGTEVTAAVEALRAGLEDDLPRAAEFLHAATR